MNTRALILSLVPPEGITAEVIRHRVKELHPELPSSWLAVIVQKYLNEACRKGKLLRDRREGQPTLFAALSETGTPPKQ